MSTYTLHKILNPPFRSHDPLRELLEFYSVNGYTALTQIEGELPESFRGPIAQDGEGNEDEEPAETTPVDEPESPESELENPEECLSSIKLFRGKKGASIWSSDMTELYAEVRVEALSSGIKISYEVETTLQHFTQEDRDFWDREVANAEKFLTGKVDQPIDWRGNESIRVEAQQKEILFFGVKAMVMTMAVVFLAQFFAC